jgi:hypothetical protein
MQSLIPSSFFSGTFTYVLSQSSSGTALQRKSMIVDEVVSIKVSQMGVECSKGACASTAPSATKTPLSNSGGVPIEIIAGVIAVIGGFMVVVVLVAVVVVAIIVKRRKKRAINIYSEEDKTEEEEIVEPAEPENNLITYNAFTENAFEN